MSELEKFACVVDSLLGGSEIDKVAELVHGLTGIDKEAAKKKVLRRLLKGTKGKNMTEAGKKVDAESKAMLKSDPSKPAGQNYSFEAKEYEKRYVGAHKMRKGLAKMKPSNEVNLLTPKTVNKPIKPAPGVPGPGKIQRKKQPGLASAKDVSTNIGGGSIPKPPPPPKPQGSGVTSGTTPKPPKSPKPEGFGGGAMLGTGLVGGAMLAG